MRNKKAAPKFTGDLAKPIVLPSIRILPGSAEDEFCPGALERHEAEARNTLIREQFRKLSLLAQHYGFDHSDPSAFPLPLALPLLLALCCDLIDGFKIEYARPERRGRRTEKWGPEGYSLLIADVEDMMAREKCGTDQALWRLMEKNPKYRPKKIRWPLGTHKAKEKAVNTLGRRLSEARSTKYNPLADLLDQLRARGAENILSDALKAHGK